MIATVSAPPPARPCVTLRYADRSQADDARRQLRKHLVISNVSYCDTCDAYHVNVDRSTIDPRELQILSLLAQGVTRGNIARELGGYGKSGRNKIYRLFRKYYAANACNLVAITIALGIVDTSSFVPMIREKNH